jgi:hypothetical protein
VFSGEIPLGNFKGRYAGRIGRQNWKSLNFSRDKKKSTPFPLTFCLLLFKIDNVKQKNKKN